MSAVIDQAVNEAMQETFGARPRVAAARAAGRTFARHAMARRANRRDHLRAGWGTPGWQTEQAYAEPYAAPVEEDYQIDAELEQVLSEPDDDYDDGGEEYGRRGRGGRGRMRPPPEVVQWHREHPVRGAIRRRNRFGADEFGEDQGPQLPAPTYAQQQPSTFTEALKYGLGFGVGFLGVALVVGAMSRGASR